MISATDEIYEGLYQLADCFVAHGRVWKKVRYWVGLDVSGAWKFKVEFAY